MFSALLAAAGLLEKYTYPIALKSPCIARSEAWFKEHKSVLVAAARTLYTDAVHARPVMGNRFMFPELMETLFFNRVVKRYNELAATGKLVMTVGESCCTQDLGNCHFIRYQCALLVAIRQRVSDEESVWPRDF